MTEVDVTERPILFSGDMIRAILDGRKKQTRRVVKSPRGWYGFDVASRPGQPETRWPIAVDEHGVHGDYLTCPYGQPGDQLWVQESYKIADVSESGALQYWTLADERLYFSEFSRDEHGKWRQRKYPFRGSPGRFMYRSLSRIQLEVTNVRVERVQEITEEDAKAEGWGGYLDSEIDDEFIGNGPRTWFRKLWDKINGKRGYPWDDNPWVWVIDFKQIAAK